jgi:hypothetical protein
MARPTFEATLNWLVAQLVLEIDDLATVSGLADKYTTTLADLHCHVIHLKALNNRCASYKQLISKLSEAIQTANETKQIGQASKTLDTLTDAIGLVMAKCQVEISRRTNAMVKPQ